MEKELICYAIIPSRNKKLELSDFDKTVNFISNSDVLHIGKNRAMMNQIANSSNLLLVSNEVRPDLWSRIKFCFRLIFKYE